MIMMSKPKNLWASFIQKVSSSLIEGRFLFSVFFGSVVAT
jgi:hypothetical protein